MSNSIFLYFAYRISVKTSTWTRDSHGLYDYESTDIKKSEFQLRDIGILTRNMAGDVSLSDESGSVVVPSGPLSKLLKIEPPSSGLFSTIMKKKYRSEGNDKNLFGF